MPGISDHGGIPIVITSCKLRIIKQIPRTIYLYHKADLHALKIDLIKWSDEFKLRNTSVSTVSEMCQEFQTVLVSAMNCHIPTKIISKRNQTPWINRRIKRMHKRKQRAFNSYKQRRDSASYGMFSKQRKITYTETRNAHRRYISSICSDSPKIFWSYIKSLKVDNIGIPTLNNNNKLESDSRLKAEILNSQFKSVFTHENVHLTQEPSTNIPPMPGIIIATEDVARLLHGLNPNKATGPDDIPARILPLTANELAPAPQIIFQKSLTQANFNSLGRKLTLLPFLRKEIVP